MSSSNSTALLPVHAGVGVPQAVQGLVVGEGVLLVLYHLGEQQQAFCVQQGALLIVFCNDTAAAQMSTVPRHLLSLSALHALHRTLEAMEQLLLMSDLPV